MDRPIRSWPTFVFGIIVLAIGLAVVVSELTSLDFDQTAPVAGLAGGAVVLIAAIMAPRSPPANTVESATEPGDR